MKSLVWQNSYQFSIFYVLFLKMLKYKLIIRQLDCSYFVSINDKQTIGLLLFHINRLDILHDTLFRYVWEFWRNKANFLWVRQNTLLNFHFICITYDVFSEKYISESQFKTFTWFKYFGIYYLFCCAVVSRKTWEPIFLYDTGM